MLAGSFLLVLLAVFSTVGTVTSSLLSEVSVVGMLPVWAAAAAALSAAVTLWRGRGFFLCLALFAVAALYKLPAIVDAAKWVVYTVTNETNRYFNIKVMFQGAGAADGDINFLITLVGILIMMPLSITICLRRSCAYTVLVTVPFALPTLALNDNPPNPDFLILLISIYLVLLFSAALYPNDYVKRGMAVFPSIAAAIVLLSVARVATPSDNSTRGELINRIDNQIRRIVQTDDGASHPGVGWPDNISVGWRYNTENVFVADAGSRAVKDAELLEVTATHAGTFYLRGYSMQSFDGRTWENQTESNSSFEELSIERPAMIAQEFGELYPEEAPQHVIMALHKTGDRSDLVYYPYYSLFSYSSYNEYTYIPSTGIADLYSRGITDFYHTDIPIPDAAAMLPPGSMDGVSPLNNNAIRQRYLEIDQDTAAKLRQLAAQAGISADMPRTEIADKVAQYVSSSARYTLTPPTIPQGEDFASYFLQTSRRGYCIHFATAATLMLRALDVPARFTCGYTVTVTERDIGIPVVITDRNAHAWVEVHYDNVGWIPLEASPASSGNIVPERSPYSSAGRQRDYEDPFSWYEQYAAQEIPSVSPQVSDSDGDQSEAAAASGGAPGAVKKDTAALIACVSAAACVLIIVLHWLVAIRNRGRGLNQHDTNAAVIYAWRHITRLEHIRSGITAQSPEEIESLAMKARFSNHRITEEERAVAKSFVADLFNDISRQISFPKRIYIKYIRCLI